MGSQAIPVPFGCDDSCEGVSQILTTPGPAGADGSAGTPGTDGTNAFTSLTAGFTMPAVSATVSATVADNTWAVIGQTLFVENAGYMELTNKTGTTGMTLENTGDTGNAAPGSPVANGGRVTPGGLAGTDGSNGTNGTNGLNSFTTTTANFTMPAIGGSVAGVLVADGTFIGIGQTLFVSTAGVMQATAKASNFSITLKNLGVTGNAAPAAIIPTGSTVSPSGPITDASGPASGDLKGSYPAPLLSKANPKGTLIVGDGTDAQNLAVGSDGQVPMANSSDPLGITWSSFSAFLPSGIIVPFAGVNTPIGWRSCLGTAISRITYASLFSAITFITAGDTAIGSPIIQNILTANLTEGSPVEGTGIPAGATILSIDSGTQITLDANATANGTAVSLTFFPWGNGNGTTTFNIPDLRSRGILGWQTGTALSERRLGEQVGSENIDTLDLPTLEPNRTITPAMAGATAPYMLHATQWDNVGPTFSMDGSDSVNPRGGTTGSPPAQNPDSKMSPFTVCNWIIKL